MNQINFKKTLALALITFSCFSQAQVNLSSSLTACYSLNGNATETKNNLNGIVKNVAPANDRNNIAASALEFAGDTTSYIVLPNSPLLQSTVAVSFSGWVYVSAFQADDFVVFTKNNASSSFAAYSLMACSSAGNRFRVYKESGSPNYAEATTSMSVNTWYHVAFTIDNTSLKIYVNGVLEDTAPSTTSFDYDNSGKMVILGGSAEFYYNKPFKGRMDNVRFYNRVINASEVLALYQQDPTCLQLVSVPTISADADYAVFPNPATNILQVEVKTNGSFKGSIYSASGQLVKSFSVHDGSNQLSIEELPVGMYVLVVDGAKATKTFVKE